MSIKASRNSTNFPIFFFSRAKQNPSSGKKKSTIAKSKAIVKYQTKQVSNRTKLRK
jgi:hypothetical protein